MNRIVIFSLAYFPQIGGAEVAIKEITDRISDIEFHLITQRFHSSDLVEEKVGNVYVHRVGNGASYLAKILYIPRAARAARRLHAKHHFNGAWAMMCYMTFPLTLLRILGVNVPYALTLQEGDPFEHVFERPHIRVVTPFLRAGFRNARVVQAISNFLGVWARRGGAIHTIEIIPNGVDTHHFSADIPTARVNEISDSLGKNMGDVFLITTSRLVHKNAVDDVIRALPHLPANVHFVILGTGPEEQKLKALANTLSVDSRVRFVGFVDHKDMPTYLKASDIFIRPSRSEGMGNSFIEAMAAELPVIATQEGGIADFLFDEKRNPDKPITGWAIDTNSPEDIAMAVKDIMARPEKVRAVVETAKQMVIEKYDWDIVAKEMREKVFARLFT